MKNGVRILVSSQTVAKLFSYSKEEGFKLLQLYDSAPFNDARHFGKHLERPHKREQTQGMAIDQAASKDEDIRHHFIHHVCERLYKDLEKHHFKYLCLFAEAKTLGDLRKYLHKTLLEKVTYEATTNLAWEPKDEIIHHFEKIGISNLVKTVL